MNVLLVEDDCAVRQGFAHAISRAPDLCLTAAPATLKDARRSLAQCMPDVLLVDLGLPDGDGIDLIREVYDRAPQVSTMVVTMFGDEHHVFRSLEAGATGYLLKDSTPDEIVASIRNLISGGSPISPLIARQLLLRAIGLPGARPKPIGAAGADSAAAAREGKGATRGPFSEREHEILRIIARGFKSEEISQMLSISTHTVISHVKSIYQKLAVHSRAEAIFEARQLGLLD